MKINEYFYRLKGEDDFVTKNHMHNEIEMIHVISGSGTVLKDDRLYLLQDQFLYIIDSRKPHIVNPSACDDYIRNKIVVDADSFFATCKILGLESIAQKILTLPPISTDSLPEIDQLFKKITASCSNASSEGNGFACGYLIELIQLVTSAEKTKQETRSTAPIIRDALDLIMKKNGMTTLSEISAELHISKYYLCHLFKEEIGITLSEYLAEKRFETCVFYLTETYEPLEKIAILCGFSGAPSLTRFFKRKSGICPKDYRKQNSKLII